MQLVTFVRAFNKAQQLYFSSHGKYADSFGELDFDLPPGGTLNEKGNTVSYYGRFSCTIDNTRYFELSCYMPNLNMLYIMYFRNNRGRCRVYNPQTNTLGNKICASLGHKDPGNVNMSEDYAEYLY
ncbi:MAG: type IV pilin-like G/H family protein [Elusimicrobiota bacterium]|nr:type IV pilin-like G/H family protein [Elusimicrobiota bacterium]